MLQRVLLTSCFFLPVLLSYQIRLPSAYVREHPCISACVSNFSAYEYPTNILESDDYAAYLGNLSDICPILNAAHECVAECQGSTFNPFSKRLYQAMCKPERLRAVQPYLACMKQHSATIRQKRNEVCGSVDEILTSISNLTLQNETNHNAQLEQRINLFQKFQCGRIKCFVQCSRSLFSKLCPLVNGDTVGNFLKHFILDTLHANVEDRRALHAQDNGPLLPKCTFIQSPDDLFSSAPRNHSSSLYISVLVLLFLLVKHF